MIIGFVKERPDWEYRTAVTPQTAAHLLRLGHSVFYEENAGLKAGYTDNEYEKAGACKLSHAAEVYKKAEMMLKIWAPEPEEYKLLHPDLWIAANFESLQKPEQLNVWQKHGINALALERLPRLSRVQDIDILSSQNNLAGYKAALIAMNMQNTVIPLMMTSAGTLAPLKALVLGVGVAGLQAIATLQRMGAVVYASDIRAETAEQVTSLGAQFIAAENDNIKKQLQLSRILITSALSPTGRTPQLVSLEMLKQMPYGSVAVDMAGGNIEGAGEDKVIPFDNVKLLTATHLAADVAQSASRLYARNMQNLLERWSSLQEDKEVWPHILINRYKEK